jgi:glycosyltransferase involved in cell wall biosynthesis
VKLREQSAHIAGKLTPFLDRVESGKLEKWEHWIAHEAAACFVCSEQDRAHFPAAVRSRIHVLPNGARFEPPAPAATSNGSGGGDTAGSPPRLLLLGDMGYLPNADSAIAFCANILSRIRAEVPAVEVAIVGNHPGPEVKALAEIPGVQVTGFVPDVTPWFRSAAILVVPIRFGGGTRIKILEALRHRRAVVTTPAGAAGLDPVSGRHLIVANDDGEFAAQVVALLRDPARRAALGAAGEEWARATYDWDRIGDRLLAVVDEVAGRR